MRVLALNSHTDLPEFHAFEGLMKAGVELHVVSDPLCKRIPDLRAIGAKVFCHHAPFRFHPSTIRFLGTLLSTTHYDIAHYLNARLLTAGLLVSKKMPIRSIAYRGTSGHLSWWDPASRLSYLHPRLDRIICVSNAVRQYLLSMGLPEKKLMTIYKGHHLGWYPPSSDVSWDKVGVDANSFIVTCTANVRPVKGVDTLIAAWNQIPDSLNATLVLIGKIKDREALLKQASPAARKRIVTTGFLPDAALYSGKADCFIMPSRDREGLPRAMIEAMSQGVAPIVTNVGGMPEVVRENKDGLVVPPNNPQALANAIITLAKDDALRARFAESAKERIATSFRIEKTIEETLALYRTLLSEPVPVRP